MSRIDATVTTNLEVNGKQVEDKLEKLRQRAETLHEAMDKAAKAGDKVSYDKWKKELRAVERETNNVQNATKTVEETLQRLDAASPKALRQTLRSLERDLQKIERGSKAWDEQVAKIHKVKDALSQANAELRQSESLLDRLNGVWNRWQTAVVGGVAAFTGLVMSGKAAVNAYAEMEQEMANVRKYTGMTEEQVADLNEELKKINTRTPREELNKLAQDAGRLGKTSKDDVLGFVRAADKINVALDDLGDGATLTLSKLTGVFGDEERLGTEKSLLAVGSVINELSQNCRASAPYLADFAERMGGVGAQANMTVSQIMGFGAVLDSNSQKVEASATALSQVIVRLYQDPAKYAKVAGLDVQKFANLMREDANAALLLFLKTLQKAGGMDVLSPMFKDMGENGSRAITALSTLALHIDEVKAQQEAANVAFEEATSIDKEFAVQNETVQASLDKAKNKFNEMAVALGEKLVPVMRYAISGSSAMLRVLSLLVDFVIKYKVQLVEICAAIAVYSVAVNLATIRTKALAAWMTTCRGAAYAWMVTQQAWAVVTALCTGNLHRLGQEFKLLSAMLKTSALGLIIVGIAAATVAVTTLIKRTNELSAAEKSLIKVREEAQSKMGEEKSKIDLLVAAAENENLSLEERKKAIAKLNSIIPDYNAKLDETSGKYTANKQALDEYLKSLVKKYELEGAASELADIGRQKAQLTSRKQSAESDLAFAKVKRKLSPATTIASPTVGMALTVNGQNEALVAQKKRDIEDLESQLAELQKKEDAILNTYGVDLQSKAANSPVTEDYGGGGSGVDGDASKGNKFAAEDEWRKQQEAIARIARATGSIMDVEGNKALFTAEDYAKRMFEIEEEYLKKKLAHADLTATEELELQAQYEELMKKGRDKAAAATLAEEEQRHKQQLAMVQQMYIDGQLSKKTYDSWIEAEELLHQQELVRLTAEGSEERLKAEEKYMQMLIAEAQKRQKETERLEQEHQKALAKIKSEVFGLRPEEKEAQSGADLAALKEVYDLEVAAAEGNADELLRIEEAYQVARLKIKEKYGLLSKDEASALAQAEAQSSGDAIIDWMNSDGGQAIIGTVNFLTSNMSAIFSQLSSMVQAELEIQSAAISKRYDAEINAAQGNSYKVAKLEKKKEEEISKAKNEANRKLYNMQVIQAVAQSFQAGLNAYTSTLAIPIVGPTLAPAAMALALATSALQVAALKKQQQAAEAQGYAEGGFTKPGAVNEPAGIVHAGEWVASQKLVNSPVTRPMIDALERAQRNNTIGSFGTASPIVSAPTIVQGDSPEMREQLRQNAEAMRAMSTTVSALKERLDDPFVTVNTVAGNAGYKQAEDKYLRLMRNVTPKTKRKK